MTNNTILLAAMNVANFLKAHGANETPIVRKLQRKTFKQLQEFASDYNELVDDIRIKRCLKGERGEILYKDKEYLFNEEGLKAVKSEVKELNKTEAKPFTIDKLDWTMLTDEEKKFFVLYDEELNECWKVIFDNL